MKRIKELRLENGKKLIVILSSACMLFILIILGLRKIHRQELPHDFPKGESKIKEYKVVEKEPETDNSYRLLKIPQIIAEEIEIKISALLGHASVTTTFEYYCDVMDENEQIINFMNNTFIPEGSSAVC